MEEVDNHAPSRLAHQTLPMSWNQLVFDGESLSRAHLYQEIAATAPDTGAQRHTHESRIISGRWQRVVLCGQHKQ